MTRLLVSVRSVEECTIALRSAVDLIDIKEPTRGSLGAADPVVIQQIVATVARQRPVSVALGELLDFLQGGPIELPDVEYVKLGLADCAALPQWQQLWCTAWQQMPSSAQWVAVAYADAAVARSPKWQDVLASAHECGCSVLLLDTFDKSAGGLMDWLDPQSLEQVRRMTRACGMHLALAGSLTRRQLIELLDLQPDFVAVRSAVCHGRRQSRLSGDCIDQIVADMVEYRGAKT